MHSFFQSSRKADKGIQFEEKGLLRRLSYHQLADRASWHASRWKNFTPGRRCIALVWMESGPDYLCAIMALAELGYISTPLHANTKPEAVGDMAKWLEAEIIIVSSLTQIRLSETPLADTVIVIDGHTGQRIPLSITDYPVDLAARQYEPPAETAMIMMSSGSTGKPKGIMLSAENLLSNVRAIQQYVQLNGQDCVFLCKSPGYASTITGEWLLALHAGANIRMHPGIYHPLQLPALVNKANATFACVVPSMLVPLLKRDKWSASDWGKLRKLIVIGGAMAPEMLLQLHQKLPQVEILPSYGLTEASPRVSYLPFEQLTARPQSVGIPVCGVDVSIRHDGREVPAGAIGEVVVTGPGVMIGYYRDPERTSRVLKPYGLLTSDLGYVDRMGYLYITGRADNAVNIGGHTVYPEYIEKVLLTHPAVEEAAVCSVKDSVWGERLIAFVVSDKGQELLEELQEYCTARLLPMQRPKRIVITTALPATASGKLDRTKLAQAAKEEGYVHSVQ